MLKLNDGKTELLLLGSPYLIKENQEITIAVGDSYIESVSAVHNLGAFFDEHMSMDVFVHKKCAAIQGQLRKLYRIRTYLTVTACKSLKCDDFISCNCIHLLCVSLAIDRPVSPLCKNFPPSLLEILSSLPMKLRI